MQLYSTLTCPYAHRTRLVLTEKSVNHDLILVDLARPGEDFLALSPYGKVPLLVHGSHVIHESTVCNEYLEEMFPREPLMPMDPVQRAQLRIWINYCDEYFLPDFYALMASHDKTEHTQLLERLREHFTHMETAGIARLGEDGDYWLGKQMTLLDVALYPFFERLPAWKHFRALELPGQCERLQHWLDVMSRRPSIRKLAGSPDSYIEHYRDRAGPLLAS